MKGSYKFMEQPFLFNFFELHIIMKRLCSALVFICFILLFSCEAKSDNFEFKLKNYHNDKQCTLSYDGNRILIDYTDSSLSNVKHVEYVINTINTNWITDELCVADFLDDQGKEVANIHLDISLKRFNMISFKDKNGIEYYVDSTLPADEFTEAYLNLLDYLDNINKLTNVSKNKEKLKFNKQKTSSVNQASSSSIDIISMSTEDLVTRIFAIFPIAKGLPNSNAMYNELKTLGLNPTLEDDGKVGIFITEFPEKCHGFNAVKALFKLDGVDIMPESVSISYTPSIGYYRCEFYWTSGNYYENNKKSDEFANYILQSLERAGFSMESKYGVSECSTPYGKFSLRTILSYSQWAVSISYWLSH